jgi:hypothetical protein
MHVRKQQMITWVSTRYEGILGTKKSSRADMQCRGMGRARAIAASARVWWQSWQLLEQQAVNLFGRSFLIALTSAFTHVSLHFLIDPDDFRTFTSAVGSMLETSLSPTLWRRIFTNRIRHALATVGELPSDMINRAGSGWTQRWDHYGADCISN